MRWSMVLLCAIGGLGACLGAALATQSKERESAQEAPLVRINPAIRKSKVIPLEPQRVPAYFGEKAFLHVQSLVAFGPRYSGQPGWSKQLDYIDKHLKKLGLATKRDTWTDRKELMTFTNISATIPGKSKERILLACHHDTKCTTGHDDPKNNFHFVGANDGASAVALLLELASLLQKRTNQATIELVFFDGEESLDWNWNEAARALFGSKRYLKKHRDALLLGEEPRIEAMVLLDMVGRAELHIQEELYSTELMRQICWSAAVATKNQNHFYVRAEAAADDHKPFLDVGIPAVDLIDLNGNPTWHTPYDTVDKMSPDSIQKVADVVLTMLPAIEQAYIKSK
jgi:glutaminyl-peptide cyclotransferase